MAGKPRAVKERDSNTVQVCLSNKLHGVLRAYADSEHKGKLSIAIRAMLEPSLTSPDFLQRYEDWKARKHEQWLNKAKAMNETP